MTFIPNNFKMMLANIIQLVEVDKVFGININITVSQRTAILGKPVWTSLAIDFRPVITIS